MGQDLLKKYLNLKKTLDKYDKKYRMGISLIDDDYYDELNLELKKIEEEMDIKRIDKIKDPLNGQKIKHTIPMLSLDHGFEEEAIKNFINRMGIYSFPLIVEHKVDGVSLSIKYKDSKIHQILTRGNGLEGIDVTDKLKYLHVPKKINYSDELEIRGELYTTFSEFEKIKNNFTSPRNYCASFLHRKVMNFSIDLFFVAHDCITFKDNDYLTILQKLQNLKLPVVWNKTVNNLEDTVELFWQVMNSRDKIEYPIDGIVLKINDSKKRMELGSHLTAPRYAMAVKVRATKKTSEIKEIFFSVGKFGNITPVAIINPVKINNFTVNRVSMHNINEVNANNYGVGDIIEIERAGEAVPQIVRKVFDANSQSIITNCPSCNKVLVKTKETIKCPNSWNCPSQKIARISHFCSRNAMNIEGLSEKRIHQLIEEGLISFPNDLFKLQLSQLADLDGWNYKSAENLLENLEKSRKPDFENLLFALCIPNIGYGKAIEIKKHVGDLDSFIELFKKSMIIDLPRIGRVAGESIFNFLNSSDSLWISELKNEIK